MAAPNPTVVETFIPEGNVVNQAYEGNANVDVTTSGTVVFDVPGATVTFALANPGNVMVWGAWDCNPATLSLNDAYDLLLSVDGVTQAKRGKYSTKPSIAVEDFAGSQVWLLLLAAGSHTLKLQVQRTAGTGTVTIKAINSGIDVLVL